MQPETTVVLGELQRFRSHEISHKNQIRCSLNCSSFKWRNFKGLEAKGIPMFRAKALGHKEIRVVKEE